jgi:S1-C subfamily serine protease
MSADRAASKTNRTSLESALVMWNTCCMKFLVGILAAFLALPVLASEKMTSVTIDGASYLQIQDVHVVSGGRIVILYSSGGTTVTPDKLPQRFLDSWGITAEMIAASKAASEKDAEQSLAQAVRAGYFREVDGVVYDLRKAQAGWKQFTSVKILQVVDGGALIDPNPNQSNPEAIYVRNLPRIFVDNDSATFMARLTGDFSYVNKFGYQHTVHAYDVGRVCKRNEIPDLMIKNGLAAVSTGSHHTIPSIIRDRPTLEGPDNTPAPPSTGDEVRGIGSGFFVTRDGYLLTNFHVVHDAAKVKVRYKNHDYAADVVEVDRDYDLAVLKISGADVSPLAISRKDSAELGDSVFTIGFPNIEMQGMEPKYTDGKISSLAGMQDDPHEYQISVPVQPGNSGGPLCDANGDVVGIVVARLNDLAALRESGAVPQNVNYAVKSKLALRLLHRVNGLDAQLPAARAAGKPVKAVEDSIAMVMIY